MWASLQGQAGVNIQSGVSGSLFVEELVIAVVFGGLSGWEGIYLQLGSVWFTVYIKDSDLGHFMEVWGARVCLVHCMSGR